MTTKYLDGNGLTTLLNALRPSTSGENPADLGTAAIGSSKKFARADHVHKKPTASDIGAATSTHNHDGTYAPVVHVHTADEVLYQEGTHGDPDTYVDDALDDIYEILSASAPTDTKNTAGATNTQDKIFIVGAKAQADNPVTYTHDTAYVGTDGHLYSNSLQVVNLSGSQALTNKTYDGYTLGAACAKGVVTSLSSDSANLPTATAVRSFVSNSIASAIAGTATFQGVAPSGWKTTTQSGTPSSPPQNYKAGWYWIVGTAGYYAEEYCEPGDMIFCIEDAAFYSQDDFSVIQTNLDIAALSDTEINSIVSA